MRLRRALRRLFWVLVKSSARAVACACGRLLQRCVGVELAAERGLDQARGSVRADGWAPLPRPARLPSDREVKLANYAGHNGCGLYVLDGELAAVIANAGRC